MIEAASGTARVELSVQSGQPPSGMSETFRTTALRLPRVGRIISFAPERPPTIERRRYPTGDKPDSTPPAGPSK